MGIIIYTLNFIKFQLFIGFIIELIIGIIVYFSLLFILKDETIAEIKKNIRGEK